MLGTVMAHAHADRQSVGTDVRPQFTSFLPRLTVGWLILSDDNRHRPQCQSVSDARCMEKQVISQACNAVDREVMIVVRVFTAPPCVSVHMQRAWRRQMVQSGVHAMQGTQTGSPFPFIQCNAADSRVLADQVELNH